MEFDQRISNNALARYRIGNALVWAGVLTWLPFIALRIAGQKPSLLWFLPFHLLGVVGGSRIRSAARKTLGERVPKKSVLQALGHILICAGILVWAPYFYLKYAAAQPVDVDSFLPYHLTGILSGLALLGINYWRMQYLRQR